MSLVPNRSYFFKQWTKHAVFYASGLEGVWLVKTFVSQEDIPTSSLHQDLRVLKILLYLIKTLYL